MTMHSFRFLLALDSSYKILLTFYVCPYACTPYLARTPYHITFKTEASALTLGCPLQAVLQRSNILESTASLLWQLTGAPFSS